VPDAERATRGLEQRLVRVVDIRWNDACERAIAVELRDGIGEDRQQRAREFAEGFLAPAPIALIVGELTRLRKVTAARGQPEADWAATLRVYSEDLVGYPADVIQHACRRGGHKWWPPPEDLRAECERLVATRRLIADALRRPARARVAERPRMPPSEDDVIYVNLLVAGMRGILSEATATAKASVRQDSEALE
jgi:hypothetical protein